MTIATIIIVFVLFMLGIAVVLYFIGKSYRAEQEKFANAQKQARKTENRKSRRSTGSAYRDFKN